MSSDFDAKAGARHVVRDNDARRLVLDLMDQDGGIHLGASARTRLTRELRMLAHYLQSTTEGEQAVQFAGPHVANMAELAEVAAELADAESDAGGARLLAGLGATAPSA